MTKWYDPISERWITPRPIVATPAVPLSVAERVMDGARKTEADRIWRALLDCCART